MSWGPHPVLASGDTVTDCAVEQTCRRHAGRETEGKRGGVLAVSEGHWPEDQGWVPGLYSPAQRTGVSWSPQAGIRCFRTSTCHLLPSMITSGGRSHSTSGRAKRLPTVPPEHCPALIPTREALCPKYPWPQAALHPPSRSSSNPFLIRAQAGPQCSPEARVALDCAQRHQASESHSALLVPISAKAGILQALAGN